MKTIESQTPMLTQFAESKDYMEEFADIYAETAKATCARQNGARNIV